MRPTKVFATRHPVWVAVAGMLVLSCSLDPVALIDGGRTTDSGASGGASSETGGQRGSGGDVGSGGAVGSGGVVGSGGNVGSGGSRGSGGATGSGGAAGSGGRSPSGGDNGGGGKGGRAGGTGGVGGAGGVSCDAIQTQYSAALKTAEMCNPALDRLSCQSLVPTSLACPSCKVHVDSTDALASLQKQWTDAGCDVPRPCPAIACINPGTPTCTEQPDGTGSCLGPHVVTPGL